VIEESRIINRSDRFKRENAEMKYGRNLAFEGIRYAKMPRETKPERGGLSELGKEGTGAAVDCFGR